MIEYVNICALSVQLGASVAGFAYKIPQAAVMISIAMGSNYGIQMDPLFTVIIMEFPVDKIGEVIGPGGKTIKNIIAEEETKLIITPISNILLMLKPPRLALRKYTRKRVITAPVKPNTGKARKVRVFNPKTMATDTPSAAPPEIPSV